jgi:phosphoesterase RecJ-like protein
MITCACCRSDKGGVEFAGDVCKICGLFGGGGHPQAAGARLVGPLEQAEEKVLQAICHEVRTND